MTLLTWFGVHFGVRNTGGSHVCFSKGSCANVLDEHLAHHLGYFKCVKALVN